VTSRAFCAGTSLKPLVSAADVNATSSEATVAGEAALVAHHTDAHYWRVVNRVALDALSRHALSAPEHMIVVADVPTGDVETGIALKYALVASDARANRLRLSQRASVCAWLAAKTTGGCNG
jgi:hypothetical protein